MSRKIEQLLQCLREAIHDAVSESPAVAAVMMDLEREGHCPAFLVDVGLPHAAGFPEDAGLPERERPSLEVVTPDGPLFLTASDEDFLRNIGVATPGLLTHARSDS
jgi:hypothetical protein